MDNARFIITAVFVQLLERLSNQKQVPELRFTFKVHEESLSHMPLVAEGQRKQYAYYSMFLTDELVKARFDGDTNSNIGTPMIDVNDRILRTYGINPDAMDAESITRKLNGQTFELSCEYGEDKNGNQVVNVKSASPRGVVGDLDNTRSVFARAKARRDNAAKTPTEVAPQPEPVPAGA